MKNNKPISKETEDFIKKYLENKVFTWLEIQKVFKPVIKDLIKLIKHTGYKI